jgi:LCP family protein required for cell wall assembly
VPHERGAVYGSPRIAPGWPDEAPAHPPHPTRAARRRAEAARAEPERRAISSGPEPRRTSAAPERAGSTRPGQSTRSAKDAPAGRKHRSPLWAKLVVVLGAIIMLGSLSGVFVVRGALGQIDAALPQTDLLGSQGQGATTFTGNSIKGPINVLLVGVDTRPTGNIGSHADTMIIAHIPATHDHVYLISIPRDTSVMIPPDKATHFGGGSYKINAAFTFGSQGNGGESGGFQLLAETIKQTWGITFNGGAIVNFGGFESIVKKLGGVDMYVDEDTWSIHHGYTGGNPDNHAKPFNIDPNGIPKCTHGTFDSDPVRCAIPGVMPVEYKKGFQHLSAYQALDFVRCRDGLVGTDYARQRHQQQFIKAVLTEGFHKGFGNPTKLLGFVKSIGAAFNFDRNGVSLSDWIFTLKGITPDSMITIKTNDGGYVHYAGPARDSRQSLNAASLELFADIRDDKGAGDDKVQSFLAKHADWVAKS